MASLIRKTATPARTKRMSTPAPFASCAKTRSPTCRTGFAPAGAEVLSAVVELMSCSSRLGPSHEVARRPGGPRPPDLRARSRSGPGGDAGDGRGDLAAELVGQRGRARRLRRDPLAVRAGDVG